MYLISVFYLNFNIMAIVDSVVIGSGKNRIGEVVLATVKGRTIARKYQVNVHNPRSQNQISQRNRMANCIQLYKVLSGAVSVGFSNRGKFLSVYNAFVASNIGIMGTKRYDTVDGIIEDATGDIVISTGSLGTPSVTYGDNSAHIDFSDIKDRFNAGDKIRLFGLDTSGKPVLTIDAVLTETDLVSGVFNVNFAVSPGSQQYKFGAVMYTQGVHNSTNAVLTDWINIE
jgi:hypothetical protein